MGLIGSLDRTPDALTAWDTSESVGNNATASSSAFDLGPSTASNNDRNPHGELCQARFSFTTCSTTVGDMVVVSVQGSNSSDFSTDVFNLGSLAVGATTIVTTNLGITQTTARGRGEYLLPFYNIGLIGDTSGTSTAQSQQACRYVRIQTKTIGASSACVFSVRIEKL